MKTTIITITDVKDLDKVLMTDDHLKKEVRKMLGKLLRQARNRVSKDARGVIKNDPRHAYKAVKHAVYKQILGGNISILNPRKASSTRAKLNKRTKLSMNPHQRGGNRMKRCQRTEDLDSYYGKDRGFILRFLNAGTSDRVTKTHNARRGNISARNWFAGASHKEMELTAEEFAKWLDEEISKYN